MAVVTKQLEDILVEHGKVSPQDLQRAKRLQESNGEKLNALLVKLGMVSERDMAAAIAERYNLRIVGPDDYPEVPALDDSGVSLRFLKDARVIPLYDEGDRIGLAMADPLDDYAIGAVEMASGKTVEPAVGISSDIENALERVYGGGRSAMGQIVESMASGDDVDSETDIEHLKDLASEAPVIRLVNLMIQRAVDGRASDIHIEPFESHLKVRYRVDGVLVDVESPPSRLSAAMISRIKIMAKLNIAERRLPQDGRIQLRIQGKEIDLRVSTVPTMYGESVVMRILDKANVVLDFETLGFADDMMRRFREVLAMPHGIIVVTGPTGSGKTTTLYTALQQLNTPERKILTVEDPVEYHLEGVNQIQVKPQIDLTFANALRAIVRQDPDVIMIGEIRDLETAKIAVQSALTGHLVLSTLHTNDAAGGVTRLLDMGVDDYLLTSTVNGILGQRLIRTLCEHCREVYPASSEKIQEMQLRRFSRESTLKLARPTGCPQCNQIGYRGRAAIVELLVMSDTIRSLVMKHAGAGDIETTARSEGMRTMFEDGLAKSVALHSTIEEVLRVTQEA